MAVFAGSDLKKWREAQGISAADLAERISCDTTTIYRYESGKLKPSPDVMFEICEALGDVDRWTTWMRTEFPTSYGRMHPETSLYPLCGALMSMFTEIDDVMALERQILKDAADGRIDCQELAEKLQQEVTEMIQSAQRVRNLVAKQQAKAQDDDGRE